MTALTEDGPLRGGTANVGLVVRVGDTVHRPTGAHTPSVHALLRHLARSPVAGRVPDVVGVSGTREVLGFLDGTAATAPLAAWALTERALQSVGALLRDLHDSAEGFDGSHLHWQRQLPPRWRGALLTHNDLNPANVIFGDGRAVGLIDFDLAAPGCRAFDLAVTACFWAPLRDRRDIYDERRDRRAHRLRVLLDGYRADTELRREVCAALVDANQWIAGIIEDAAQCGHPAFGRLWQRERDVHRRAAQWLASGAADELELGLFQDGVQV